MAVEHNAQKHMEKCKTVQFESRGLLVNPKYPYLGASIDGLVICEDCGTGLIEVKCPYSSERSQVLWRHMLPMECGKDDFVVRTKKGISVQRIPFSSEMWEKMLPKLKAFYLNGIQPELFTSRVRRGISLY